MRKKERDEIEAMEEALRANSGSTRNGHKRTGSGLIKNLDIAELQYSDDFMIQQKKEMEEQMVHLLERQSASKPIPIIVTEIAQSPGIEVVDEHQRTEVASMVEVPSKQ